MPQRFRAFIGTLAHEEVVGGLCRLRKDPRRAAVDVSESAAVTCTASTVPSASG